MIVSMKRFATKAEIESVRERISEFGYKIHAIEGEERVVIAAVGVGDTTACLEALEAMVSGGRLPPQGQALCRCAATGSDQIRRKDRPGAGVRGSRRLAPDR